MFFSLFLICLIFFIIIYILYNNLIIYFIALPVNCLMILNLNTLSSIVSKRRSDASLPLLSEVCLSLLTFKKHFLLFSHYSSMKFTYEPELFVTCHIMKVAYRYLNSLNSYTQNNITPF